MGWLNLVNRVVGQVIAASDINTLMENIRVLGGNGTSAPSSDIETLFTNSVSFTSQAGPPSSTPSALGEFNLDTTANRLYVSTGTASSADWDKIPYYEYGTDTLTAGAGDLTINLKQSWEDGLLILVYTDTSTEYYSDNSSVASIIITTYDALVTGGYSSDHSLVLYVTPGISPVHKSTNGTGVPKSATTLSFTINDDGGGTRYIKWAVIA